MEVLLSSLAFGGCCNACATGGRTVLKPCACRRNSQVTLWLFSLLSALSCPRRVVARGRLADRRIWPSAANEPVDRWWIGVGDAELYGSHSFSGEKAAGG